MDTNKKPDPVPCSICGEMIEPYIDSGKWVWSSHLVSVMWLSEETYSVFHRDCAKHAKMIKRIIKLEKRLEALETGGVVVDFTK